MSRFLPPHFVVVVVVVDLFVGPLENGFLLAVCWGYSSIGGIGIKMERPNLINSQNHWMNDLQSTFLVLSASFSSNSCCFSSGNSVWDNFKNRSLLISLRFRVCVAVFIHEKDNWQCFPPFCHATFQHALITCCNVSRPERGTLLFIKAKCITIGIHLSLVKATWPRID